MRRLAWLKYLRIVISLLFLLFTVVIFLDPAQWIPEWFTKTVVWSQFAPSLLKFIVSAGVVSAGFILFSLLALVFGRLYCSTVCPVGTIQDIVYRIKRKLTKARALKFAQSSNILRYSILIIVAVSVLAGYSLFLTFLDPYSNFGRIMTHLFRPVVQLGGNGIAGILHNNDIFFLPKTNPFPFHWASFISAVLFLLTIVVMSWSRGRLFCNTICPVGALLSLFSRFSLFKISLDKSICNSCGHCSKVCKAQCIDIKTREVDFSRCISCFNCLDSCPSDGVLFKSGLKLNEKLKISNEETESSTRRNVLKGVLLLSAYSALKAYGARVTGGEKPTEIPEGKINISSPPGSLSHDLFNKNCTACNLCVSVCPTHVLQPAFLQYGMQGLMQPYMDYHSGFCNFDCTLCSEICPAGAILPVDPEVKKLEQIGIAKFIEGNCVVYTDNTDCGACSEHCPTKAVDMVPYKDGLTIPKVDETICIGCGACEYACPTRPYRAIYVEGNLVHKQAEKPVHEEIKIEDKGEDFPF